MAKHHPLADIRNLRNTFLTSYKPGFPILKELIQNAEDAGSSHFDYGWIEGISDADPEHPLLRDPALFVLDNGRFTDDNAKSIQYFSGWSSKPNQENSIGKFGLGLKSVFHLCEAFFYISNEIESFNYKRYDIFNPWAEDRDKYHQDWDNFSSNDCEKLKEKLKFILSREEYQTNWFVLWIPLRQKYHCIEGEEDGIPLRCIKYSDDDFFGKSSPSFLHENTTKQELALLLPLLHSLHTVRYWERSLEKETFSISIDGERRCDLQHRDTLLEKAHYFNGDIAVNNEYKILFSARELIVKNNIFQEIISKEDFPCDFKYIKPHIAVVLTQWKSFPKQPSTLIIRNAVFLPIGSPLDDILGEFSQSYCLTLHGDFLVDSARTGILGWNPEKYTIDPQKIDGDDGDSLLKKKWNFTLYKNLLAEVIPELERLPKLDITSVCQALKKSKLFKNNEDSICNQWQWVYQLHRKYSHWKIISSKDEKRILQIPRVPDLVWQIAPALGKLADDIYLIEHEDNCPNLILRKCLDNWHDSDIIILLEPSLDYAKILTNLDVINFLIDLVKLPSKILSDQLQKKWKQVLRKAFQATGIPSEPTWDSVGKATALLDKDKWFPLKFDDSQLLQDLSSEEKLNILVIPQDLAPPSQSNPKISGHDAGLLIPHLISYREKKLQESKQLIKQVVEAIPSSELAVFRQAVNNLNFVPGFDCRSKCERFYSPLKIEELQKQGLLFKHSSKSQEFSTDIQIALKKETLVLVEEVIANKLLQPQKVRDCDRSACLSVLQQKPELSDVENRTNLLNRLLL